MINFKRHISNKCFVMTSQMSYCHWQHMCNQNFAMYNIQQELKLTYVYVNGIFDILNGNEFFLKL